MRWSSCVSWRRTGDTELRRPSSTSSSSDTPRDEPKSSQSQDPSLARLFSDAALFGKILTSRPDLPDGSLPVDGQSTHDSLNGFSRLVAPDLDDNERAVSEKFAQISVSNWSAAGAHTLPPGVNPGESDESASDDAHDRVSPGGAVKEAGEPDFEAKLDPIEIVDLLEQEFGALAPDGEERLLLESDATLLRDVVILGVVHLTTHRLTFHASLLSSQPNYQQGVIKSGPVFVHRKGLYRKKRVWLQLSPDMISTYNSSRDEDKIKPIRSILLSSVKDVSQVESKPRHITTLYESAQGTVDSTVEFDTDESACDWKRELLGALFLYRRNRRSVLTPNDADDLNAVRVNIPLSRLESVERTQLPAFAGLFSFTFDPTLSNGAPDGVPTEKSASASEEISILDTPSVKQVLQLGILREDPLWKDIMAYADKEKLAASKSNVDWPGYRVFIDLDPRTSNAPETSDSNLSDLVKSVSFTLGLDTTKEMWIKKAHVHRFFGSYYGQFAVTTECVGFWSKSVTGGDIRYRVPLSHVKAVKPHDRGRARDHTLVLEIQGQRSLHVGFSTEKKRDEAIDQINRFINLSRELHATVSSPVSLTPAPSRTATIDEFSTRHTQSLDRISESTPLSSDESTILSIRNPTSILAPLSRVPSTVQKQHFPHALKSVFPKAINLPEEVLLSMPSKHFACLTIGSRGDVQPYIALGRGLQKEGHRVTIVTHEEYKEWVTGFGLEHRTAGGDPGALMKLSVENKMFSPQFFKESLSNFRTWLDDLLVDSWEQCKDVDVILESPSAMAGVHIAEALHIPYFRTFTMPWTKTKEFPHAFLGPPVESPTFNAASYVLFDNVLWTATSSQINRWRKNTLGIGHTDMGHLAQSKIPFIYNFSQAVVPKPLDWGDATVVSGYWFLDNPELGWSPPQSLVDWMAKARNDGKPIVYIGFGSITVPNPKLVTERIIRGVLKSGVRAIISKGWSARMSKGGDEDVVFPEECYSLDKVPHDWLFPQIDAALHHGGAGTTGASLRGETSLSPGIPTLIRPWFGDQFFWASRVQKLGAGIKLNSLHSKEVSQALKKATSDRVMKEKATSVGERIRQEDGVRTAISTIYTYLPRAGRDRKTIEH
ncbi:glycosyltransferase family 1 protein [Lactarius hengduanensis]|nr:glycosyltransferase family 1 protein [Lactarius hengduanensis]